MTDQALIALQGPEAAAVLAALAPEASELGFMRGRRIGWAGRILFAVTRSGYTGEDGFEIMVDNDAAPRPVGAAA